MERIKGIRKHVGVLERRSTYLQKRIDDGRLSEAAAVFEERERKAIDAAATALQMVERLQDVATSPVLALEELLDSLDGVKGSEMSTRAHEAIAHARAVLSLVESIGD